MSKNDSKQDDQNKLISFRVDDVFMKRFEALKERFSASGKKTSTSDLARSLLESASVQNAEFGDLLANVASSVREIIRLYKSNSPLRRSQWELVSYLINDAYQKNARQAVNGQYYKAALMAFSAWRRLSGKDSNDRYFKSNLRQTGESDLLKSIDAIVQNMPQLISNSEAEFGARNFNVAMRDEIADINVLELNDVLLPYLSDLLPVVIRAVYQRTKTPLYEKERNFMASPIRPIKSDRYWLNILVSGDSFTAGLELSTHRSIHPINSFLQFQELVQIFNEVSEDNLSASSSCYWLSAPIPNCMESYHWRYYGHQMTLNPDEFVELKQIFATALQQGDVKQAVRGMIDIYGDI